MLNCPESSDWFLVFTIDRNFAGELTLPKAETLDADDLITGLARMLSRLRGTVTPASLNQAVRQNFPGRQLSQTSQSLQTDVLVEFVEDPQQDQIDLARTVLAAMSTRDYEREYTNFYHLQSAEFSSLQPYSSYRLEEQLPNGEIRQRARRFLEDELGMFQPGCGFPNRQGRILRVRRVDLPDFREELRTAFRNTRNPAFLWNSQDYHIGGEYVLIPYFNAEKWIAETGAASLSQYYRWFSAVKQRPTLPLKAKYRPEWKTELREPVIAYNLPDPSKPRFPSWLKHE